MTSLNSYFGTMTTRPRNIAELTVSLPEELRTAVETRARSEARDLSDIVASAISLYLQRPTAAGSSGSYGQGRLFRRGNIWWLAVWGPDGKGGWKEIRETTRTSNEKEAREILRKRIRLIENHRDGIQAFTGPSQERMTVNALLDSLVADYQTRGIKSLRHCINHMKPVRRFFGERRVGNVTPDLVRKYLEIRKSDGRTNAKINREVELLNAAFCLAVREGRLNRKPHVPKLRERNARTGFFEKDEYERILACLSPPIDDMARFAYSSGWRYEEIRTLRWESVDRQAKEVSLVDSKNGEGRVLPLEDEGWRLVERLWALRRFKRKDGTEAVSEFVFHRKGKPVSDSVFGRAWRNARSEAKLPDKLFHDFRRTAARNMIRAGVAQTVAMAITGHKTDSMFRRYNVTSPDDKREALRRQREYLAGLKSETKVTDLQPADSDKTRTIG
jgi:integrase